MNEQKKRHGCLTAWLGLMLILNSGTVLLYVLGSAAIRQYYPSAPDWAFLALILLGVLNIVFTVALFRWKKWGFWGAVATSALTMVVNLVMGLNMVQAMQGLIGLAILFGVLQIGKESKGWQLLE